MITAPSLDGRVLERRTRHVPLGRRLEVLQLIHAGRITAEEAAVLVGVSIGEIQRWQSVHADDEIVSVGRRSGSATTREELDLLARRGRLVRLLRSVEGSLRDLHAQLMETTRETRSTMA